MPQLDRGGSLFQGLELRSQVVQGLPVFTGLVGVSNVTVYPVKDAMVLLHAGYKLVNEFFTFGCPRDHVARLYPISIYMNANGACPD